MVIFRVIERLGINTMIGNGWAQYAVTVLIVLVGTIIFSAIMTKILDLSQREIRNLHIKFERLLKNRI